MTPDIAQRLFACHTDFRPALRLIAKAQGGSDFVEGNYDVTA
jgi:hypothetical protein